MKKVPVELFRIAVAAVICILSLCAVLPGIASASECTATISSSLVVHVPVLHYAAPGGDIFASIDFQYVPDPSDLLFVVTSLGVISDPHLGCAAATLVDNLTIYIPDLEISGAHFWIALAFDASRSSSSIYFKAVSFGPADDSQTVGQTGGTISLGDLAVTIPSGSLSSSAPIAVADKTAYIAADSSAVSGVYSITGIPADFSLPITLRLKANAALSGTSYFEARTQFFDEYWKQVGENMLVLPLTESSGYLTATLPVFTGLSGLRTSGIESQASNWLVRWVNAELKAVSSKRTLTCSNGNFSLTLDKNFAMRKCVTEDVCDLFETARKQYADVIKMKGGAFPLSVYVIGDNLTPDVGNGNTAEYSNICGSESLSIAGLDASECSTELKENVGHELMHKFTTQYDPRTCLGVGAGMNSPLWFEEAVTTWAEQTLVTSGYVPANSRTYKAESLKLYPASTDRVTAQRHGYGLAPFIKYVENVYGQAAILSLYSPIENSSLSVEKRVISGISTMGAAGSVWTDYINHYLSGQVYSMPADYFLDSTMLTGTKEIKDDSQAWTSTKGYGDLEAKLYRIQFTGPFSDANRDLTISITDTAGKASMLVFEIPDDTSGSLVFRDEVTDQVIVNPGAVTDPPDLLIAVVNQTAEGTAGTNNTITLEIKWTGGDGSFSYSVANTNVTLSKYIKGSISIAVDPQDSGTYVRALYAPDEEGVTLQCPKPAGGMSNTYRVCGSAEITSLNFGNVIHCYDTAINGYKWEFGTSGNFVNDSCVDVTITSSNYDVTVWFYDVVQDTYFYKDPECPTPKPYVPPPSSSPYDYTLYMVRLKCAY